MTTLKTRKVNRAQSSRAKTAEVTPVTPRQADHPLDAIIGIFKDEPLMDALMERVRADRRAEAEAGMTE